MEETLFGPYPVKMSDEAKAKTNKFFFMVNPPDGKTKKINQASDGWMPVFRKNPIRKGFFRSTRAKNGASAK